MCTLLDKLRHSRLVLLFASVFTDGKCLCCFLFLPDNNDVWDLLYLRITDFFGEGIAAFIDINSQSCSFHFTCYLLCILNEIFCDRDKSNLLWSQPQWECSREMFNQYPHKSFWRSDDCSMDHHWCHFFSFIICIDQFESLWHDKIKLDSGNLPFSSQ